MLISDIYADAKSTLGNCDEATVFRRIEDAVQLITQKGIFDASLGQLDICACDGCITLPNDVGTVLAANTGGMTTLIRDQWFSYHLNGPGDEGCCVPCQMMNEEGEVCTFKDPPSSAYLVAVTETALDNGVVLRVFGWDSNNKRIFTANPTTGVIEDGFIIPTIYGFPVISTNQPTIAKIDRIQKAVSKGYIKLVAIDSSTNLPQTTVGYYQPYETDPRYRRIRVGGNQWVRIRYKKKNMVIRSQSDWINVDNRQALLLALKAIRYRDQNQFALADQAEQQCAKALSEEAQSKAPPQALNTPQIMFNVWPECNEGIFY